MIESSGFNLESLSRGLLGMGCILAVCYLLSYDRKRIDWRLTGGGLLLQIILALSVLYVPFVGTLFEWAGRAFVKLMDFTNEGLVFLLGPYAEKANGFSFLLHSLPIVIFFSALVSLFYYWGIIQRIVGGFSWVLRRFMNVSGSEGLIAAGNIFMGMTESPVLIKNYLPSMNRSEIFLVMVSGMGTIAGSVMGTYIGMLGGDSPAEKVMFAKHLLSASVMAAPGAIVIAKMLCPQTEPIDERTVRIEKINEHSSPLGALGAGTATGVRLLVNIAAMLLVFIGLVALVNYISKDMIGHYTGLNEWIKDVTDGKSDGLTFQFLVGIVLAPFMWLTGVPAEDMALVGSLLGQKTILNEFVAYAQMEQWKEAGLFVYKKSMIMATYILCGFANISSIGILLGGMGVLAPEKKDMIIRFGFPAMIGGALVSVMSATIIGMIMG
ncbi:MAG: Na+ dependent nucleoside transporter [Tannerellaceae bacterium]|jgi:CNT family concentrative nucleoside transporter|nr:Na+ dependent nucleoside transporter [Tannerellaceae bacterium]